MRKVLFLPLLTMRSGHHQVAEALMDAVEKELVGVEVKKVDIFSYTNKTFEKLISKGYLSLLYLLPGVYNFFYRRMKNKIRTNEHRTTWKQFIFIKKMEKLLEEERPDLIVCTQAFPSKILSYLKSKGKCDIPVVNVYTDFFINGVWGIEAIDLHLLPNVESKEQLGKQYHIPEERLIVSGIPVHDLISQNMRQHAQKERLTILIAGGNCGLGGINELLQVLEKCSRFEFVVLCGNNKKLYEQLSNCTLDYIRAVPYISTREEMSRIYDSVDAIITKPGGVTVSEALKKGLPIFVHDVLPGQEELNLTYLKERGLVFELNMEVSMAEQLSAVLENEIKFVEWTKAVQQYYEELDAIRLQEIVHLMEPFLHEQTIMLHPGLKLPPAIKM